MNRNGYSNFQHVLKLIAPEKSMTFKGNKDIYAYLGI